MKEIHMPAYTTLPKDTWQKDAIPSTSLYFNSAEFNEEIIPTHSKTKISDLISFLVINKPTQILRI